MKRLGFAMAFVAGIFISANAQANCGKVTIAEMNWASAQLMANVDKIFLEKGYGCEVELVSGSTMPTFTSMNEKGQPDVAPELWANAVRNPLKKAEGEGRLHSINMGPITGLVVSYLMQIYSVHSRWRQKVGFLLIPDRQQAWMVQWRKQ